MTIYAPLVAAGNPFALLRQSVGTALGRAWSGAASQGARAERGERGGTGNADGQARAFCFSYFSRKVRVLARAAALSYPELQTPCWIRPGFYLLLH